MFILERGLHTFMGKLEVACVNVLAVDTDGNAATLFCILVETRLNLVKFRERADEPVLAGLGVLRTVAVLLAEEPLEVIHFGCGPLAVALDPFDKLVIVI